MRHGLWRPGASRYVLLIVAGVLLAMSTAGIALAADRWSDITDAQWQDTYGVSAAEAATVADGYPDGTFRPYLSVTRGQFSKMAVNGLGLAPYDPVTPSFSDVPRGSTFYTFVEGAAAAGVINGFPDGTFRPENSISRQQANSMMGRHLSNAEIGAQGSIKGELGTYPTLQNWYQYEGEFYLGAYLDSNQIELIHKPTTAYLVYHEVVVGSNQRLNPTGTLTRAQAVAMVLRTLTAVEDVTHTTPPPPPTDMTTTPTSPSADRRPTVKGMTTLSIAEVVIYDTFDGVTSELTRATTELAGNFITQVPVDKSLVEGQHLLTAKVKDSHDRISDFSAPISYRVDLTVPTVTITQPGDNTAIKEPKPAFAANVTDSGSGVATVVFQYAADATTPAYQTISTDTAAPYEAEWPTIGLPADGRFLFRVVATDRAGNQTVTTPASVILDRISPTAEIEEIEHDFVDPQGVYLVEDRTPFFAAGATDPAPAAGVPASGVARVDFYFALRSAVPVDPTTTAGFTLISSDTQSGYGADWGARELVDGDYLFAVRSVDRAGNTSALDHWQVVVDNAAPVVNITAPIAGQVLKGAVDFTVTWTATDVFFAVNPIKIEYSITNGDSWILLAAAMANTGSYKWSVPAVDKADCYIRITARDAMDRTTPVESGKFVIDSTSPLAPSITAVSDPDLTHEGIDGRDFHVEWTRSVSVDVAKQELYILPTPSSLNLATQTPVVVLTDNTTAAWTGTSSMTRDSANVLFDSAKSYDIYVVAVDAGGSKTPSAAKLWPAPIPAGPTGLDAHDPDPVVAGVLGEDFNVTWTPSVATDVIRQDIYILPDAVTLNLAADVPVGFVDGNALTTWTGGHMLALDSANGVLAAGAYKVYVVAVSDDLRKGASTGAAMTAVAP